MITDSTNLQIPITTIAHVRKQSGLDYSPDFVLPISSVTDQCLCQPLNKQVYTRTHTSGWTISGQPKSDRCSSNPDSCKYWITEFIAVHPVYGYVWGDVEYEIYAETEYGYVDFVKNM